MTDITLITHRVTVVRDPLATGQPDPWHAVCFLPSIHTSTVLEAGISPRSFMVGLAHDTVSFSDRDLEHRVIHRLHDRHLLALRNIAVRADEGKVTLRGTVTSFYHKQLCIHACRNVPGVASLIDEVEVDSIL